MRHILFFHEPLAELTRRDDPAQAPAYWGAWTAYIGALREAGVLVGGDGLELPSHGATLSVRDGRRIVQDGPFADAREQLGGYLIVDVADLPAALDWAARSPAAAVGAVEVRVPLPPMPAP